MYEPRVSGSISVRGLTKSGFLPSREVDRQRDLALSGHIQEYPYALYGISIIVDQEYAHL